MIDLDDPDQDRALQIQGWLQLADSQGTDDLEDDILRDLADRVQILDDAVETGLVQLCLRENEIDELDQLLGQQPLTVRDRGQLCHLGLDIGWAPLCRYSGSFEVKMVRYNIDPLLGLRTHLPRRRRLNFERASCIRHPSCINNWLCWGGSCCRYSLLQRRVLGGSTRLQAGTDT